MFYLLALAYAALPALRVLLFILFGPVPIPQSSAIVPFLCLASWASETLPALASTPQPQCSPSPLPWPWPPPSQSLLSSSPRRVPAEGGNFVSFGCGSRRLSADSWHSARRTGEARLTSTQLMNRRIWVLSWLPLWICMIYPQTELSVAGGSQTL